MTTFSVKNVKTYRGHEGETLYEADIFMDNKKVGWAGGGDWGGEIVFHFINPTIRYEWMAWCGTRTPSEGLMKDVQAWHLNSTQDEVTVIAMDLATNPDCVFEDLCISKLESRRKKHEPQPV